MQGTSGREDGGLGDLRTLRRVKSFAFFLLLASSALCAAQKGNQPVSPDGGRFEYPNLTAPGFAADTGKTTSTLITADSLPGQTSPAAANPVAEVRDKRSWEYGPFLNFGTGLGDRSDYKFFFGGFELSKILSPVVHAGFLSGQFQYGGNIIPLWQAYTPPPHKVEITCVNTQGQVTACPYPNPYPYGGGTFYGVSLTPVIFRWNFLTHSRRFQPWFQAAGGLIYTTHKFPPNYLSCPSCVPPIDGGTSVWNFSPQGGFGLHYFLRNKRSIDLNVNGVHISSASLGDRNPGVNSSIQIQAGYTFWSR
jgi:lipid A 3-O-deacylase